MSLNQVQPSHRTAASGSVPRRVYGLALAGFLAHWWAAGRYGLHRDEWYYLTGGRRLELGYVDHPPLVPWLAVLTTEVFGFGLSTLRVWAALGSAISVLLASSFARTLGGGGRAQVLAALATLACPFFFFSHTILQTNLFDQLAWCVALLLLLMALVESGSGPLSQKRWLAIGIALLVGALTKYTIAVLGLSVFVALLIARRQELRRPGIYLAGLMAFLGAAPSLWWQAQHGWPFIEFSGAKEYSPPWSFLALLIGMVGVGSLPLILCGMRRLLRPEMRVVGWTVVISFAVFFVLGTKPYYANVLFVPLFGAGAVVLSATRRRWPEALLLLNLAVAPILIPVLPLSWFAKIPDPIGEVSEMVGWEELVAHVRTAVEALPSDETDGLVLIAQNYGLAASIETLWTGERPPVISGQNSYQFWMHDALDEAGVERVERAVVLGSSERFVAARFRRFRPLGRITNPWGIENDEYGREFFLAWEPIGTTEELLESLRNNS